MGEEDRESDPYQGSSEQDKVGRVGNQLVGESDLTVNAGDG